MECDWKENRQHITAEIGRVARALERMDERLLGLDRGLEEREIRLRQTIDDMDRRHSDLVAKLAERIKASEVEVGKLTVKAGVFGTIGGGIMLVVMILWQLLRGEK